MARKIRLVGLTWREKTSPKTWRWAQHADWAHLLPRRSITSVSAPPEFLTYLAADQPNTTASFAPTDW